MKTHVLKVCVMILAACFLLSLSQDLLAQDPDTLDVAPGFETLNIAVESDTTPDGNFKNLNRVYRLEREGWYMLNGTISDIKGGPIRIVAAAGPGARPMIIVAVDEGGGSARIFNLGGDAEWKGLYVTGINNLGNQGNKNNFQIQKEEGRYIMDDCFLDDDRQAFFRMNAPNQKLYITNTIMRNAERQADPWDGIMIAARGGIQDTIFIQNCTFYIGTNRPFQAYGGVIKNLIFDHNTFDKFGGVDDGGNFEFDRVINLTFTNNLLMDFGFEGDEIPEDPIIAAADTFAYEIMGIDSLDAPELATENQRHVLITNNVYGWTPEVKAWIDGIPELKLYEFNNLRTRLMIAGNPNMVAENNIEETPVFTDPPDIATIVAYADYRWKNGRTNENNPPIWADRNGRSDLSVDITTMGPAEDEFDYDYNTDSQAYTHAEGSFPVGDLNWWPDKKAEWETWMTAVEVEGNAVGPGDFELQQNYPNPFNPTTKISFNLVKAGHTTLMVYNALGQVVENLVEGYMESGRHQVTLDAKNLPSGVYICQLKSGSHTETIKMMLMK